MTLTDEQLDALAERLIAKHWSGRTKRAWREVAREAARWAAEQQGEVVWEYQNCRLDWIPCCSKESAESYERGGCPVRAIRVIATTTKEGV